MCQFFYFHLGSSNYITNIADEVSQHTEYFAFEECFVEEHKNSNNSPYKFNGKELDEESGLYYYGARYYDPRISIWTSVDPLAEQTPGWTPYRYCFNSPISYVDPNGKFEIPIHKSMTKEAAKNYFSGEALMSLLRGVQDADYIGFAADHHFDNRRNFDQVQSTWKCMLPPIFQQ